MGVFTYLSGRQHLYGTGMYFARAFDASEQRMKGAGGGTVPYRTGTVPVLVYAYVGLLVL